MCVKVEKSRRVVRIIEVMKDSRTVKQLFSSTLIKGSRSFLPLNLNTTEEFSPQSSSVSRACLLLSNLNIKHEEMMLRPLRTEMILCLIIRDVYFEVFVC